MCAKETLSFCTDFNKRTPRSLTLVGWWDSSALLFSIVYRVRKKFPVYHTVTA